MTSVTGRVGRNAVTYVDWVCPLILVKVTIQDDINTGLVTDGLHGLPHALILQVVSGVCSSASSEYQAFEPMLYF